MRKLVLVAGLGLLVGVASVVAAQPPSCGWSRCKALQMIYLIPDARGIEWPTPGPAVRNGAYRVLGIHRDGKYMTVEYRGTSTGAGSAPKGVRTQAVVNEVHKIVCNLPKAK